MSRKGTNGVSTNGVTANFVFFDRGTFWVLPLTLQAHLYTELTMARTEVQQLRSMGEARADMHMIYLFFVYALCLFKASLIYI